MKRSASVMGLASTMVVGGLLVVASGCHSRNARDARDVGTTSITSVTLDSTNVRVESPDGRTVRSVTRNPTAAELGDEDDATQLARAMCQRKLVCGDVGPGAKFSTLDGCLAEARSHATARLADHACLPDRTMLATCVASVRAERCDKHIDVMSRIHSCSAAELCAR